MDKQIAPSLKTLGYLAAGGPSGCSWAAGLLRQAQAPRSMQSLQPSVLWGSVLLTLPTQSPQSTPVSLGPRQQCRPPTCACWALELGPVR